MKKTAILAALTCAAIASPAAAQEVKAFDGPRAEVLVGYDRFDAGIDGEDFDGNSEDIFYGAAVGYDFQSVGLVFGVEGEVASSGNGAEETIVDGADELTVSLEDGVNLYGGARIGTVFGNGLIYAKAGFAHTNIDLDAIATIDGVTESDSADISFSGLRFGGGYEYSFGAAYGKLEYRYTNYSDGDVEYDGESIDPNAFGEIDLERHQLVVGLGYRF